MSTSDAARKTLAQRIAVAVVGIPIVVAMVVLGGWAWAGFVALVALGGAWEYRALAARKGVRVQPGGISLLAVAPPILAAAWMDYFAVLGVVVLVGVLLVWTLELARGPEMTLLSTAATLAGALYVGAPLGTLVALRVWEHGGVADGIPGATVLLLLAVIWLADTAAYAVGRRWGRRPLAPRSSPKKTWEGAVACWSTATLVFPLLGSLVFTEIRLWELLGMGALIGVVMQLGDLAESQLKRDAGVKDSSALLPGHGGILDRVDSLLFAAPVLWGWLALRGGVL
jgi:phosphatidate cytidylyltransferase